MYLGLLWGSVDTYNTLSFYNDHGTNFLGSITGSQVSSMANGDQGEQGTFYVNINSTVAFDTVVATSSQHAFEFDNVAFGSEQISSIAPEPSTFLVAIVGAFAMIGYKGLRRSSCRCE